MPTDLAAQQDSDRDRDMGEETDEFDPNERGGSKQKSSAKSAIQVLFLIRENQSSADTLPFSKGFIPCTL